MTQVRRTVSLSVELAAVLNQMAFDRKESTSALIEMLLREHPLVARDVDLMRMEADIEDFGVRPRKGSPLYELMTRPRPTASASDAEPPKTRRKGTAHP